MSLHYTIDRVASACEQCNTICIHACCALSLFRIDATRGEIDVQQVDRWREFKLGSPKNQQTQRKESAKLRRTRAITTTESIVFCFVVFKKNVLHLTNWNVTKSNESLCDNSYSPPRHDQWTHHHVIYAVVMGLGNETALNWCREYVCCPCVLLLVHTNITCATSTTDHHHTAYKNPLKNICMVREFCNAFVAGARVQWPLMHRYTVCNKERNAECENMYNKMRAPVTSEEREEGVSIMPQHPSALFNAECRCVGIMAQE